MSLFDEQNKDNDEMIYFVVIEDNDKIIDDRERFRNIVVVCSILSLFIAVITMPQTAFKEITRMISYIFIFEAISIIFPIFIGLECGLFKKDKSWGFWISWTLIVGLWLIGSFAY